jgi:lipopolysaccharide transport system permease protein
MKNWDWKIEPSAKWWGWSADELWSYRHLIMGLVRREFILNYQQTILGPIWILVQPILTLLTFVLVFGKLVGISTGSLPPVLFYLSGIVLWSFFSDSLSGTSNTFRENIHIFSKVYFPRIIMPFSMLITHFLRFLIQLLLLGLVLLGYLIFGKIHLSVNRWILILPLILMAIGIIGLAIGLILSVLTAKYRDLGNLVPLSVRLLMFLTPVIYPITIIPENLRWLVLWNPLTPLFEVFRYAILGEGTFSIQQFIYSIMCTFFLLIAGLLIFNKKGDQLIDVV